MYDLLSIDAWRDSEGGWSWNDGHYLIRNVEIANPTPRRITKELRKLEILSDWHKGKIRVEQYGEDSWEIQEKGTFRPIYALQPTTGE